MNSVQLTGRLTKDPEVRYGDSAYCRFTLAVDRQVKEKSADFINCVAFGKTAEFLGKYFTKGKMMGLTGRIQTGSYTNKDGKKVFSCDIVTERVEFLEKKSSQSDTEPVSEGFIDVSDSLDDEGLPF